MWCYYGEWFGSGVVVVVVGVVMVWCCDVDVIGGIGSGRWWWRKWVEMGRTRDGRWYTG